MDLNSANDFWNGNAPPEICQMLEARLFFAGGPAEGRYVVLIKADRNVCLTVVDGCGDEYEAAHHAMNSIAASGRIPTHLVAYVLGVSKTCDGCGGAPMLHWIVGTLETLC